MIIAYCVIAREIRSTQGVSAATSIATFLNEDGAFILCRDFVGSLDLSGYNVFIDERRGIMAVPDLGAVLNFMN